MRIDEWIIDFLIKKGAADVFGIPGAVILDFLYAVEKREPNITPHLTYHEQGGAFAAVGYAQTHGKIGVAYSTRGPGFTNMITAIADAYYDSVPVFFFTAHSARELAPDMRVLNNQEIDTVSMVKNITKMAVRIDNADNLRFIMHQAYAAAVSGRKGPVFFDILSSLFSDEIDDGCEEDVCFVLPSSAESADTAANKIAEKIRGASRPVFLIGNGARDSKCREALCAVSDKYSIPILSSRTAQDVIPTFKNYFGFIGSRATRYSNFILSKADLIIAIGNRMSFPLQSKSFRPVVEKAECIRIDIDRSEFCREIPNCINYELNAAPVVQALCGKDISYDGAEAWLDVCTQLRKLLNRFDESPVVRNIRAIIEAADAHSPIVCDVGNHSFWVTSAYAYSGRANRIIYSGSFGTLGSALPKAIGAYYASHSPVLCFTGDQGVQMNIQEMQYIAHSRIPVNIIIVNNRSSGMIMERELSKYGRHFLHTTPDSGYSFPDFGRLADVYGFKYEKINGSDKAAALNRKVHEAPAIIEIEVDMDTPLYPVLPAGNRCQDLFPRLPDELFEKCEAL